MKLIENIIKFLSINSVIFLLSILTFYFHASKIVGYMPTYNNPDPKQLDIYQIYSVIVNFTLTIWFFSFLSWGILLVFFIIKTKKRISYPFVFTTIILNCLPILIIMSDVFKWYMD